MLVSKPLPFIMAYIDKLDSSLKELNASYGLSRKQKYWLGFCLLALLVTNSLNWKQFERASGGRYRKAALSWVFCQSRKFWKHILYASTLCIVRKHGITEGILAVDDSKKHRSKGTTRIYKAHKVKDTSTGGYFNGQSIVFLVLVTPLITFPVGFEFYMPDPAIKKWEEGDEALKKKGIPKKQRPERPERDKNYPTIPEIATNLLQQFKDNFPDIKIKVILGDALYGEKKFMDKASEIFPKTQVISQLKKDQNVRFRNRKMTLQAFFKTQQKAKRKIKIRGGEEKTVIFASARLYVYAHDQKRFVIAFKYEDEEEYRYLVATNLSWRTLDIIQAYTFRWLVEVFFQDWKSYEGWGQLAKQPDEEGSRRGLTLSLLLDHCLLFHPEQSAQLENNLPPFTVGSLREKIKAESMFEFIKELLSSENPEEELKKIMKNMEEIIKLNPSKKHMANRNMGNLEPAPSLKCRVRQVLNRSW